MKSFPNVIKFIRELLDSKQDISLPSNLLETDTCFLESKLNKDGYFKLSLQQSSTRMKKYIDQSFISTECVTYILKDKSCQKRVGETFEMK